MDNASSLDKKLCSFFCTCHVNFLVDLAEQFLSEAYFISSPSPLFFFFILDFHPTSNIQANGAQLKEK